MAKHYKETDAVPVLRLKLTNKAAESALEIRESLGFQAASSPSAYTSEAGRNWFESFLTEYQPIGFYASKRSERSDSILIGLCIASEIDGVPSNTKMVGFLNDKTLAINGLNNDYEGSFVVTSLNLVYKGLGTHSSRAVFVNWGLSAGYSIDGSALTSEHMNRIESLDLAGYAKAQVEERLTDWENYLAIVERIAQDSAITLAYDGYQVNEDLQSATFFVNQKSTDWSSLAKLRGQEFFSLDIPADPLMQRDADYSRQLIGYLDKLIPEKGAIRYELDVDLQEYLNNGSALPFPNKGYLNYTARGDIVQARRLRFGIQSLINGKAANANLERFLFDPTCANSIASVNRFQLCRDDLLLGELNEAQFQAVQGAMNSSDLFLVQGPPGTGKTTVIAEICFQAVRQGLKVLVASQSNLAVDNALSKLVHHPKIRILRRGKADKVEDEGLPFIENNVIGTWLKNTATGAKKQTAQWVDRAAQLQDLLDGIPQLLVSLTTRSRLKRSISKLAKEMEHNSTNLDSIKQQASQLRQYHNIHASILNERPQILPRDFPKKPFPNIDSLDEYQSRLTSAMGLLVSQNHAQQACSLLESILSELHKLKSISAAFPVLEPLAISLEENAEIEPESQNFFLNLRTALNKLEENSTAYAQKMGLREALTKAKQDSHITIDELSSAYVKVAKSTLLGAAPHSFEKGSVEDLIGNSVDLHKRARDLLLKPPNLFFRIVGLHRKWLTAISEIYDEFGSYVHSLENSIRNTDSQMHALESTFSENVKSAVQLSESSNSAFKDQTTAVSSMYSAALNSYDAAFEACLAKLSTAEHDLLAEISEFEVNQTSLNESLSKLQDSISAYHSRLIQAGFALPEFKSRYSTTEIEAAYSDLIGPELLCAQKYAELLQGWTNRISNPTRGDEEKLKHHYIANCNVIGITCVQCGSREFAEEFPTFDIVVVDEVSKATPPELLLPMLKGKRIVLVGDHKQLPPMIDADTIADLAEQRNLSRDDCAHLERSLFKELYEAAPESMKCMLNVQYRMHPVIMNCINQFYCGPHDQSGGLTCGIQNVEIERKHSCHGSFLKDTQHGIWADTRMKQEHYELRAGTSYQNPEEVRVIRRIITHLAQSYRQNEFEADAKKEIGVITFYSAQVRLLRHHLDGHHTDVFKYRIGTVDRFQGIEKPIVIVSLVRNNASGKIGFARKPERINVAFSRARELLIVVGCSELFTQRIGQLQSDGFTVRDMYTNVKKAFYENEGLLDASRIP